MARSGVLGRLRRLLQLAWVAERNGMSVDARELIDTGHETIRALAEEFGIQLDDLFADEPEGFRRELFFFDGAVVPEEEIVASFLPLAEKMAAQLALAEGDDAEFERVDKLSIPQWL